MSGIAMVSRMIEAFNGIKDRIEPKISRKIRNIDTLNFQLKMSILVKTAHLQLGGV